MSCYIVHSGGYELATCFCRISKEDRAAGVLENYKEGEAYKMHGLRSFVKNHEPQIMPGVNNYFSSAK